LPWLSSDPPKDNRLTPEKLRSLLASAPAPLPLAEMGLAIYQDYQRALAYRRRRSTSTTLIRLAIDCSKTMRNSSNACAIAWPYILEDEAQDSANCRNKFCACWPGHTATGVRVGDPNQAIFETFTHCLARAFDRLYPR